ncbi:MAG: hypothetical protein CL889_01520 [Dehalococcoidia bacterium]|nr:hypothetical protein [Dehalococcoidia bacterium]|tara:strand:+ start:337 stop:939 length:603 start_codon:yes stop_codon:yes gene_type:complete
MNKLAIKIAVPLIGLVVALVGLFVAIFFIQAWWSQPSGIFDVAGISDGPEQPIAFPHTVHVQDAGLDCQFCHRTVGTDEAATVPAVEQCLFCHDFGRIDGSRSSNSDAEQEIAKLVTAFYGSDDGKVLPAPIDWMRVHRMPDHVQFIHEPHISAGLTCSTCHGNVSEMEVVKQVRNLKMRDCVDCHRDLNAPTDCATCHY